MISIIVPSYNSADLISTSLDSILMSTVNNFEIIIVDDGSTDNTRNVIKPYLEDNRIKYLYQSNKGLQEQEILA